MKEHVSNALARPERKTARTGTGEFCPRCGTEMDYVHSSVQCPDCRYKEGCCGGSA